MSTNTHVFHLHQELDLSNAEREQTWVLSFAPIYADTATVNSRAILAVLTTDDCLSVVELRQGATNGPKIVLRARTDTKHNVANCMLGLTTIRQQALVTSGNDGFIRFWSYTSSIISFGEIRLEHRKSVSALAEHPSLRILAVGTELTADENPPGEVAIYLYYFLPPKEYETEQIQYQGPFRTFSNSHSDSIVTLNFPRLCNLSTEERQALGKPPPRVFDKADEISPSFLVSSSLDGLVNIYDCTKANDDPDTEEASALLETSNMQVPIRHLLYLESPRSNTGNPSDSQRPPGRAAAVSTDEKHVWHTETIDGHEQRNEDEILALTCADYVIKLESPAQFPRQNWDASPSQRNPKFWPEEAIVALAVGAHKKSVLPTFRPAWLTHTPLSSAAEPHINVYVKPASAVQDLSASELTHDCALLRLEGAHGDEVVRDIWLQGLCWEVPTILSCGEDGTIRLWQEGGNAQPLRTTLQAFREWSARINAASAQSAEMGVSSSNGGEDLMDVDGEDGGDQHTLPRTPDQTQRRRKGRAAPRTPRSGGARKRQKPY